MTYILGIESSCDDTAVAVLHNSKIIANVVATQKIHQQHGGVVPELASRAHQSHMVQAVDTALQEAKISKEQLTAIAFTQGPGLLGSLLVGGSFAKSMALALDIPLLAIHHMKAHILAHFIADAQQQEPLNKVLNDEQQKMPQFPFLALTISGGHTQIVKVTDYFEMEVLGTTIDDAVGEAFDKTAKLLGLPYPGGPLIDRYAKEGDPKRFSFTKPKVKGLDFSFSGLKTAIRYFIEKQTKQNPNFIQENLQDICASVQHTIVTILMDKVKLAAKQTQIKTLVIGGGVSANSEVRKRVQQLGEQPDWQTFIPKFEYTTDNAAMVAIAGYYKYLQKDFAGLDVVSQPRMGM